MRHIVHIVLGAAVVLLVGAVPLLYSAHQQTHLRNFRVVEDRVLYRSGQLGRGAFERVVREYGIKTVVTLRTTRVKDGPFPDDWERELCECEGIKHVRLIPLVWSPDEKGEVPAEQNVAKFLELMRDPANHPVLVHCFAGIHRTGTMCAIYRMEHDRWSADTALREMEACGFDPNKDVGTRALDDYLRGYKPRWRRAATAP
jgi:tyrosine-protein phosphatase SIW14